MSLYEYTLTGTHPVVAHAPGAMRRARIWGEMVTSAPDYLRTRPAPEASHDFAVMTWSTAAPGETPLEECLAALDIVPVVYRTTADAWTPRTKNTAGIAMLEAIDAEYVIGLDAYDVVLLDHPAHAVERFVRSGATMLFNGSNANWPTDDPGCYVADEIEYAVPGFSRHANAGAWIARREDALEIFRSARDVDPARFRPENQRFEQPYMRVAMAERYPAVRADVACEIFVTLNARRYLRRADS